MKNSAGSIGYIFSLLKYYIMLSNQLPLKTCLRAKRQGITCFHPAINVEILQMMNGILTPEPLAIDIYFFLFLIQ